MTRQSRTLAGSAAIFVAMGLITMGGAPAAAEDFDVTARSIVGVRLERSPDDVTEGMGVYVGEGRVLTAAHLFADAEPDARVILVAADANSYYTVQLDAAIELLAPESDAAVLRVAEPGGLLAMPACDEPKPGDQVSVTRLNKLEMFAPSSSPLYKLEIDDRAFSMLRDGRQAVIPGTVESGFSGSPAIDAEGRCFYGIVSGSLTMTSTRKDTVRRLDHVVLIPSAVFARIRICQLVEGASRSAAFETAREHAPSFIEIEIDDFFILQFT